MGGSSQLGSLTRLTPTGHLMEDLSSLRDMPCLPYRSHQKRPFPQFVFSPWTGVYYETENCCVPAFGYAQQWSRAHFVVRGPSVGLPAASKLLCSWRLSVTV